MTSQQNSRKKSLGILSIVDIYEGKESVTSSGESGEDNGFNYTFKFVTPKSLPLQPVEIIGVGSFSTVCRAEAQFGTGKISFAIKKLDNALSKTVNPSTADISRVAREIIILKTISHPFLLKAKGIWISKSDVYIATQYVEFELASLFERHRRTCSNFKIEEIELFSYQLFSGLAYLHGIGIIHCDLCPRNILIDRYGHLCIADFGLARPSFNSVLWNQIKFNPIGITCYTAPELMLGVVKKCNSASDMWSAGCILFQLFNNNEPVVRTRNSLREIFNSIGTILGRPNNEITTRLYQKPADAKNLLSSITCDGIPKIKCAVQEYLNHNGTNNDSNATSILEIFNILLKQLLTYEFDKRISAKDILINYKRTKIFKELSEDWSTGRDVYEMFTSNAENLKNVKNILKENMKLQLQVHETEKSNNFESHENGEDNDQKTYAIVEEAIRNGVENLEIME